MEFINAVVNPDHIATSKKYLDRAEINNVCHHIYEKWLITLLAYKNIKIDTKKRHKSKYIGVGARLQPHKAKLKKETNQDSLRRHQNPGTPEGNRSMTSNFNVIKKCGQNVYKQGDVDYDKQTDSVKIP